MLLKWLKVLADLWVHAILVPQFLHLGEKAQSQEFGGVDFNMVQGII